MKTYKNLYPQLYTWENLERAYRRARKGKRKYEPVADFEYAWESQLLRLQAELADQSYQPGPYHSFYIHEPKRRLISAAPFRDVEHNQNNARCSARNNNQPNNRNNNIGFRVVVPHTSLPPAGNATDWPLDECVAEAIRDGAAWRLAGALWHRANIKKPRPLW